MFIPIFMTAHVKFIGRDIDAFFTCEIIKMGVNIGFSIRNFHKIVIKL